jgi:hypothetical protein
VFHFTPTITFLTNPVFEIHPGVTAVSSSVWKFHPKANVPPNPTPSIITVSFHFRLFQSRTICSEVDDGSYF